MSAPAGWYPDPQHPVPGAPPQQRYWDGQAWTQHVAPIAQPSTPQASNPQGSYPQQSYGQPYPQAGQPAYGQQPYGQPQQPTTPDGVPLANWWPRVAAYLIDGLILLLIVAILALPLIRDVIHSFREFLDEATTAAENGNPTPSTSRFQADVAGKAVAIGAISLAVNFVYMVGFLLWKQATPGKLAVGLRVRLRESPDLPVAAVLLRWVTQSGGPGLLGLVPFVGTLTGLYSLIDALWPLWDDQKQALHDKAAKTNVVRVR